MVILVFMYVSCNDFFKIWLLKSFFFHVFFFKTWWNKFHVEEQLMYTHTCIQEAHTWTPMYTWDRTRQSSNSVENILSTNTSNSRHRKEKLICGYVLKKNRLLLKHRECSISQSFHDCKARVKRRRKKVMSEAAKFVFPSSNVSAHWSLNHSHGLLK